MTRLLKGKEVADLISARSAEECTELKEKGITPTMALFGVGEKDDDLSYERNILKKCETAGIKVIHHIFPEDVEAEDFYRKLDEANSDPAVHGIMVFRPLPKERFNDAELRNRINVDKDIDGCSDLSLSGVFTNRDIGFAPCTAEAAIRILDHYGIEIAGKNITVLGRSLVIGKPVSMLLLNRNATVTICHTKTRDAAKIASAADILICATGQMELVNKDYLNKDQAVIDVGFSWNDQKQKLCGDVLFKDADGLVHDLTPVPGGVGSVTTSILISHVVEAAKRTLKHN